MATARGHFDVTAEAEPPYLEQDGNRLNHDIVRKKFSGDMTGRTEARMVAAYVAIEHFAGLVGGKSGTFALKHSGTMSTGEAELCVTIIPDSGTGELKGISGSLQIVGSDGKHAFTPPCEKP